MKTVIYYCPGCRQRIARQVLVATRKRASFCAGLGRSVVMRKLKANKA
jgi:hypothetical protein